MSDDNGKDTHEGNGSGKKDHRPELTAAEIIIVAVIIALIEALSKKGG